MLKRGFLWFSTNMAVMAVISILLKITGIEEALGGQESYIGLLFIASLIGFAGSFISLQRSKSMAKRSMGVQIITTPSTEFERWYLGVVEQQARRLGIKTPEVGIFNSPSPNAFATGASKNDSLVAISTGLTKVMTRDEMEAVIGHEMAHVANGDMVTMMLLQGVVNTFVIFLSKVLAAIVANRGNEGNQRSSHGSQIMFEMLFQLLFGFLAQLITSAFSRYREYRADAGGAKLTSAEQMARALEALQRGARRESDLPDELKAFGIAGGFASLFSTHPPLERRIAALRK